MSTAQYVNVKRSLQNLENSELSPENVQAIREFVDHCAAEGLSDSRQQRHIQSLKKIVTRFAPDDFQLRDATEQELKTVMVRLNRTDYADATIRTMQGTVKKFYKVDNGGHEHPEKVQFFTVAKKKNSPTSSKTIPIDTATLNTSTTPTKQRRTS